MSDTQAHTGNGSGNAEIPAAVAANASANPAATINERLGAVESPKVMNQEMTFYFKAPRKDPTTGEPPVDKETGEPIKARPPVKLMVPIPTMEYIIDLLTSDNDKYKQFVINTFADLIKAKVREQVNDENNPVNRQEDLNLEGLTLEALAEEEPAERAGRGILKETWAEFEEDYIEVMVPATGRSLDKVKGAAKFLAQRLYPVRTNRKIVTFLASQLDIWAKNSQRMDEFNDLYQFLVKKADSYINMGEDTLLANLE